MDDSKGHGFGFGRHGGRGRHGHDFHGEGHDFGFGRREGFGWIGRMFARGNLQLLLLHLIAEKPRHGYELIKVVEELSDGSYVPSPGTIYPALSMLDDRGYVTAAASDNSRKLYSLTDEGNAYLRENHEEVQILLDRIHRIGESRGGEWPPQVIRAVENFKMALRMRLERKPLDEQQIRAITDALDEAARKIEQC